MKFSLQFWLHLASQITAVVLPAFPGVPAAIAPYVSAGIQSAEQIPGATGPQKLSAALAIANDGFTAAQAAGAHKDVIVEAGALTSAVSAIVAQTNATHAATTSAGVSV